jgi:hypothetical protein
MEIWWGRLKERKAHRARVRVTVAGEKFRWGRLWFDGRWSSSCVPRRRSRRWRSPRREEPDGDHGGLDLFQGRKQRTAGDTLVVRGFGRWMIASIFYESDEARRSGRGARAREEERYRREAPACLVHGGFFFGSQRRRRTSVRDCTAAGRWCRGESKEDERGGARLFIASLAWGGG